MFTGIVTAMGTVRTARRTAKTLQLVIAAPYRRLMVGESIAVDGACLTVVRKLKAAFAVQVVASTTDKTTLGEYAPGRRVNLERSLAVGDRLGGHLVAGHVDGVGTVTGTKWRGGSLEMDVRLPAEVARYTVPRGSLAVDGVSLTVASMPRPDTARIALIPHTLEVTTLGRAAPGVRVNLEADQIGKLVAALAAPHVRARRRTEKR